MSFPLSFCFLSTILSIIILMSGHKSHAADITLGVIGPHEYDLPVDFKPFNAFVQYGDGNAAGLHYNNKGQRHGGNGNHSWSGMSKYVHFWSFDSVPGIGFAYEVIQTESFILANGKNYGGLGTTITGPAVWFKPNKKSTLGMQVFMQTPSGTRQDIANNYWSAIISGMFDYEWDNFSFDGDFGGVPASTKHIKGQHSYHPGTVFFTNLRFSWKASHEFEPFFAFDWQNAQGLYDYTLNQSVPDTNSREIALGVGLMWNISSSMNITARYSHSVEGRNVPETDAYYLKFAYLWDGAIFSRY
ncbi:hypothetical protein DM15PD_08200 [Aristophania vespae]|nr:hypothetical protein DM15PD_08200 [Aristophania vespae]